MRALAAGKHVLVEKPYTRRPEQVEEAWDEAARRELVVAEAYMWRHAEQTRLLLELLPRIGEVQSIAAAHFGGLPREDDVRYSRELGGGALLDLGCYCVSAARLVAAAEPDQAYGEAVVGRGGVDVRFAGTLGFGELVATFSCGFTAEANPLQVIGSEGMLEIPGSFAHPAGRVLLDGVEHRAPSGRAYRAELDDFCAAIRGERKPLLGRAESLGQARALAALLRSAEAGAPVAV